MQDLGEIGGELGLLVAAFSYVRVRVHDLPPGQESARCLGDLARDAPNLPPLVSLEDLTHHRPVMLLDVLGLRGCAYGAKEQVHGVERPARLLDGEAPAVRPGVAGVHDLAQVVAPGEAELVLEDLVVGAPHELEERLRVCDVQELLFALDVLDAGVRASVELGGDGVGPALPVAALQLPQDVRAEAAPHCFKTPIYPIPVAQRHERSPPKIL